MTLQAFLEKLEQAGFELDAEQILDALWLASQGCQLTLHETGRQDLSGAGAKSAKGDAQPSIPPSTSPKRNDRHDRHDSGHGHGHGHGQDADGLAPTMRRLPDTSLFPRGRAAHGAAGNRSASPVPLPAPKPLPDRLALMRALKPFTQRWPSRQHQDVDEEKTVEAYADMAAAGVKLLLPVMRPRQERWFDVEIVSEDANAIELWDDMLAELAETMRETGAFGQVRRWQLRMPRGAGQSPWLENAMGARSSTSAFVGKAARRLIVFVSQGTSPHWADGSYGAVLGPWLRDNAAVLLQLTPSDRWVRGWLGDPHGTASTSSAGAPAAALRMRTQWWRLPDDEVTPTSVPLPVVTLAAADLAQWAGMQMARGHGHPAYLLETAPSLRSHDGVHPDTPRQPLANAERALALLKYESPDSFRFAVMLSIAPFTLTVARLMQALIFHGNTDPALLAEVMRSGLIVEQGDGGTSDRIAEDVYYIVHPDAHPLLERSLRDADATALGRQIEQELARHLERAIPGSARSAQLIEDEEGTRQLPAWARPFATVATALLGLPENGKVAAERVGDVLGRISPAAAGALSRLAQAAGPIDPALVDADAWAELLGSRLVHQRADGNWAFAPGVRKLLSESDAPAPSDGPHADWLAAALAVLQSMALSFHMSHIVESDGRPTIRALLSDWVDEQVAGLNTWMAMSEYIFHGPVTTTLICGVDPIRDGEPERDEAAYRAALTALEKWVSDIRGSVEAMVPDRPEGVATRIPTEVRALQLAIRLSYTRDPAEYDALVTAPIDAALREFSAGAADGPVSEASWWWSFGSGILAWLRSSETAQLLGRYCGQHFARFVYDGWSPLALCRDYHSYVERLLSLWASATDAVFARSSSDGAHLTMTYSVDADALALVAKRFPEYGIVVRQAKEDRGRWSVERAGYRALIDDLGGVVRSALLRRQGRPARHPRVLWVDDYHSNNETERERFSEFHIDFTLATSTEEAVGLCKAHLYDAVLSDMGRAPDARAGLALLRRLRQSGNRVPFVIYAATERARKECLDWGALGVTNQADALRSLLVRALLRNDDVLDRPVDAMALAQYTERQFPALEVVPELNARAADSLDSRAYPTLVHVDRVVERLSAAVRALVDAHPESFGSGTGCVIASLALTSQDFTRRYGFSAHALEALAKFLPLVQGDNAGDSEAGAADGDSDGDGDGNSNGDGDEDDEVDEEELLDHLQAAFQSGALPDLNKEIERQLQHMVESAPWDTEFDTYMFHEADDVYAELLSWEVGYGNGETFDLLDWHEDVAMVSMTIAFVIRAHATVTFSVKDYVDKDMVEVGYAEPSREFELEVHADASLRRVGARGFEVESVNVMGIPTHLDFGHVAPDDDDPEPDEPEPKEDE